MAERVRRFGGSDEPEEVRNFWTGDVWKVLLALNKYRQDLAISYLDCPPTGLVVCGNLDRLNTSLKDQYNDIVAEFSPLNMSSYGLEEPRTRKVGSTTARSSLPMRQVPTG
jgi:hypothetical protein